MQPKNATNKIELLGSYSESKIISDPFGGNAARYEQTYKECLTAITAFLSK